VFCSLQVHLFLFASEYTHIIYQVLLNWCHIRTTKSCIPPTSLDRAFWKVLMLITVHVVRYIISMYYFIALSQQDLMSILVFHKHKFPLHLTAPKHTGRLMHQNILLDSVQAQFVQHTDIRIRCFC